MTRKNDFIFEKDFSHKQILQHHSFSNIINFHWKHHFPTSSILHIYSYSCGLIWYVISDLKWQSFYMFCLSWFSMALLKCVIVYFLEWRTMLLLSQFSSLIFSLQQQPLEMEFLGHIVTKHRRTSPTIPHMCVKNASNLYALWFRISC